MSVVVRVENVSKKYNLGGYNTGSLKGDFNQWWTTKVRRQEDPFAKIGEEVRDGREFWALKDVSFEIRQGEAFGIIGKNGAGKSTLLKILSRITLPTTGSIKVKGRIASLLEVGTGFNPELSGRENIYLNGAILGMTKAEVVRKFDEIVDFSGVEQFIDTPVKRYSSGMYVRLAFAVAAHLDSEILILDEVLAVGDAEFQIKCLKKMNDVVKKEGRTVIFVSHDMNSVLRLCEKAILLQKGLVKRIGASTDVADTYNAKEIRLISSVKWEDNAPRNQIVKLVEIKVHTREGETKDEFDIFLPVGVTIKFQVSKSDYILIPALNFHNEAGINIFDTHDINAEWRGKSRPIGEYSSTVWIPSNFFSDGLVIVSVAVVTHNPFVIHLHEKEVLFFNVNDSLHYNSPKGDYSGRFPGIVRPLLEWNSETHQDNS